MSEKHTPGPWTVRRSRGVMGVSVERWAIDGPPQGLAGRWWVCTAESDEPTDEANAEFIVRACNSHDDLLAALKELLEDPDYQIAIGGNPRAVDAMLARARAAIAKAEPR